jgi:hypothetical protein
MEIIVWKYNRRHDKQYRFFVKNLVGDVLVRGNKKFRYSRLLSRTKFEKRNPMIEYSMPDEEFTVHVCNRSLGV